MRVRNSHRHIIEGVYASWKAHDLAMVAACVHENAEWLVHLPPGAWPLSGAVRGKDRIMRQLRQVQRDFKVIEYRPLKITKVDTYWVSRARIHYGHWATGLTYDATITNFWQFERDKIRMFEAFHDAARLRAFYEMVNRMAVEA